jgi:uncharacterized OsmC-like protein
MSTETPTAITGCLTSIDREGLEKLIVAGKSDPTVIKTVKCRTVAEGRFRHLNFIRNLPAHVIDEPPGLLGDDTAPNPSEAVLAALGSCLAVGIHANAVARGIPIIKLEIELEGDINITSVWGTGDLSDKPVGFTDVRARVNLVAERPREELEQLIRHCQQWSPVANTISRPVNLAVTLA